MVMFVLFSLTGAMLVADLASGVTRHWAKENVETLNFVLGTLGFQGATIGWTVWLLRWNRLDGRSAFGWGNVSTRYALGLAVGGGLVTAGVAMALGFVASSVMSSLGYEPQAQAAVQILESTNSLLKQILYGGVAVLVAPVAEEVLFRGILYPTIKQLGLPRAALWSTSILFGLIHLNWMAMIPLTAVGLLFTWLYEQTGDLRVPIAAHSVFNLVNLSLLLGAQRLGP